MMNSHVYYITQFDYLTLLQKKLDWTDNQLCENAFRLGVVFADLCKQNDDKKVPSFEEFYDKLVELGII